MAFPSNVGQISDYDTVLSAVGVSFSIMEFYFLNTKIVFKKKDFLIIKSYGISAIVIF